MIKSYIKYYRLSRGAKILWKKRFKAINKNRPELLSKIDKKIEKRHLKYWSRLNNSINLDTLRVSCNISGVFDPHFVPEEVYVVDIEPTLNDTKEAKFFELKNYYEKWFSDEARFPESYLHKINGVIHDGDLNMISNYEVEKIIEKHSSNSVLKLSKDTYGGENIFLSPNFETTKNFISSHDNVVFQEKIELSDDYTKITNGRPVSSRLLMYKSVSDNKWYVLSNQLRMAVGDSLDNTSTGGIVTCLNSDGFMDGYATDRYGKKIYKHPDSNLPFEQCLKLNDKLISKAISICQQVHYARLLALDLVLDRANIWRMIEVNVFSLTIRNAQYHGKCIFGDFTEEIVNYCMKNHWASHKKVN